MDVWEKIIVQWINSLQEDPADHIQSCDELEDGTIYYRLINRIKPWDCNKYNGDSKKSMIMQFLNHEYPNITFIIHDKEFEMFTIAILVLSRLSLETVFHTSLCSNMQSDAQVKVKSILESVYDLGKKITLDDVQSLFLNTDKSTYIETPNHVLKEFLNSPVPQTVSKDNKIFDQARQLRHLRADIETLRYEKSELIEDLKIQDRKVNELQLKLQEALVEIKSLRDDSLKSNDTSFSSPNKISGSKSNEVMYAKELHSLEKYVADLQEENNQLLKEKSKLEAECQKYKSKYQVVKEKNKTNEHVIESVLQQIEKKEDELTDLNYRYEELRLHFKQKPRLSQNYNEHSFESRDISRLGEVSLDKSEILSSVVEVQLQDTKKELIHTQNKYKELDKALTVTFEEYTKFMTKYNIMEENYIEMKNLYDTKCAIKRDDQFTQTILENQEQYTQTEIIQNDVFSQTEIVCKESSAQTESILNQEQHTQTDKTIIHDRDSQTDTSTIGNREQYIQTDNSTIKNKQQSIQTICSTIQNKDQYMQTDKKSIESKEQQTDTLKLESQDIQTNCSFFENKEQQVQTDYLELKVQHTQTMIEVEEQCVQTDSSTIENKVQNTQTDCIETEMKGNQTDLPNIQEQYVQTITSTIENKEQCIQTNPTETQEQSMQTYSSTIENKEQFIQTNLTETQEQSMQTYSSTIENKEQFIQTNLTETQEQSMQTYSSTIENKEQMIQTHSSTVENQEQSIQTDCVSVEVQQTQTSTIQIHEQSMQTDSSTIENKEQMIQTLSSTIENQEQSMQTDCVSVEMQYTQTSTIEMHEQLIQTDSSTIENKEQMIQTYCSTIENQEQSMQTEKVEMGNQIIQTENLPVETQTTQTELISNIEFSTQTEHKSEEQHTQTENNNVKVKIEYSSDDKEMQKSVDLKNNIIVLNSDSTLEQYTEKLSDLFKILFQDLKNNLNKTCAVYKLHDNDSSNAELFTLSELKDSNMIHVVVNNIFESKLKLLENLKIINSTPLKENDVNLMQVAWKSTFESINENLKTHKVSLLLEKSFSLFEEKSNCLMQSNSSILSEVEEFFLKRSELSTEIKKCNLEGLQTLSVKLALTVQFVSIMSQLNNSNMTESENFKEFMTTMNNFQTIYNKWNEEHSCKIKQITNLINKLIVMYRLAESCEYKLKSFIKQESKKVEVDSVKVEKEILEVQKHSAILDEKLFKQKADELLTKQKQQFENYMREMHEKYELKLEKMKDKMKTVYNSQIAALKKEQEQLSTNELKSLQAKIEQQCYNHTEELKKYKKHISELTTQLWDVGEKLIIEKQKKEEFMSKLKETKIKYENLEIASKRNTPDENFKHPPLRQDSRTLSMNSIENIPPNRIHFVKDFQIMGNAFKTEDEEGEIFDPIYLTEMQRNQTEFPLSDPDRLSVLQMRNAKCKPHLKSSYATEMLNNPVGLTEDEIRTGATADEIFNDSWSHSLLTGKKVKKKDRTRNGSDTPRQSRRFSNIFRKGRLSTGGKS
ncbi:probable E3 ubiquitin-protein ligase bre1 [Trichogramma pretiosum]|uniref:probable E3 ubiquitin-protein ligase bre1 n=1 Tax=Trichogramma pretiosum TaxID=7493 RepID=UPI000C7196C7|nr:probable E3 ubiquitin-protein ligase bre1 [Trichogramma pretiosum]XP_014229700.2 probable E3 ubiquitin-protein ligase bre1 [Trichogramma pretiosum]XP_014229701.2 probable E3 ubiquitin-protein ligase bre1 [Trichogramma pretiosum]